MFLDKDYSINNPTPATSYNSKGFPTSFGMNLSAGDYRQLMGIILSEITYSCNKDESKNKEIFR
jgi:hypothetical protein